MNHRYRGILLLLLVLVLGLPLTNVLVHLLTEVWWFNSVGFAEVFWTRLIWQVVIWGTTFLLYASFLWGNYRIAMHQTRHAAFRFFEESTLEHYTDAIAQYTAVLVTLLVAFGAAASSVPAWEIILKFLHPTDFSDRDPIFQHNIGFYVFQVPLLEGLWNWCLVLVVWGLILSLVVYTLKGSFLVERNRTTGSSSVANRHLYPLLAALFFLIAVRFWLDRYQLLLSTNSVGFGAGYTDIHARLFAYGVMSSLAIALAILFLITSQRRNPGFPTVGIGLFVTALILLTQVYPFLQQKLIVAPNEVTKEKPYITHNIQFTQAAYHLENVQRQNYPATAQLNRQILQENQPTIRNIRLWDYRPLLSTYRQLQEIRLYYKFHDVDVDRYTLNGKYQQVMLSARELVSDQLPSEARTWVNQRLKYTHGYGLVMSPVNQVTSDGLPELYVKDIPPVTSVNLPIHQPAIYYGEETNSYIFTGTTTPEFDYSIGDKNAFTTYSGTTGVPIPSLGQRLAYAYEMGSLEILLSNYFTNQSHIHYHRQIQERVQHVAPFLRFDNDPYLAVINGRMQWLIDAYTVSDRYPYAKPIAQTKDFDTLFKTGTIREIARGNVNYIRNSVKVLVDAYDGTLRFFAVDESDPILQTYRAIFPHLFEPYAAIPPEVKAHFRYPLDFFQIQAQMYLSYHMSDPETFYNQEDLWRSPIQTYEGGEQIMQPYYVIMRLPGEAKEGFILILPFTPSNKDNMIAWLAARSNGHDYGNLLLYEFPKQKLVYGPRQIEARIDQDPQISQQFTLWSQAGSKVIRGDLLVIPIQESLLYVEPIYLRAEQGELPELKRVIVAYDKSVVMATTLEQALATIFGGVQPEAEVPSLATGINATLVKSALDAYKQAQNALRQGNWAEYGRYQQQVETILQQLNQKAK
jgi:uncharacterized membrane protein (UPF0182 family)